MAKMDGLRGSERVMAAWKARTMSEESVKEIASAMDKSKGQVVSAQFSGGAAPTGLSVSMVYVDDSLAWCGNDIEFWLAWLRKHGGKPKPPRIIINGQPVPDFLKLELDFGIVPDIAPKIDIGEIGNIAGGIGRNVGG